MATIFERPEASLGKTMGIVGGGRPVAESAEAMPRLLNKRIDCGHIPGEPTKPGSTTADLTGGSGRPHRR